MMAMPPRSGQVLIFAIVVFAMHSLRDAQAKVLPATSADVYSILPKTIIDEASFLTEHGQFIRANMNLTVNPCENFYQYACGGWQNDTMVPAMGRNNTFFFAMQVKVNELVVEFLRNTSVMDERTAETKAKKLFASCMNMSEDLSHAYEELLAAMHQPELKEGEVLDWTRLNFYSEYGLTPFLPLSVQYNSETLMFEMLISAPYAVLTNTATLNYTRMKEDLKFKNEEEVKSVLEKLKTFEKHLIETTTSLNKTAIQTVGEFIAAHNSSGVDWKHLFELAFNGSYKNSWKVHNTVKDFTPLNKYLTKSDTAILLNYVKWWNILNFYHIWKKQAVEKTLESKCREITVKYFSYAFIPWFIETTYDQERRADVLLLSKRVKDTFYMSLDHYTWLDEETRSGAKTKLRAMDLIVGYTDDMTHRLDMDHVYKDMNMTQNYWENLMILERNRAKIRTKAIGKSVIAPIISTHEVNAYYADYLNLVFVAIGISQLPLYHIKLPYSLKFGGIGNIIGHEIGHGFDSTCYEYDYDGKKRNWWTEKSLRNFKERYQCLESQYNKFIYHGLRTNGTQTSGDNIADNVGARIAYFAYLRFLSENPNLERGDDKPLPGMDFTNKQLFFLKFAQTWCDGRSPEDRMRRMEVDDHAYEEFRVVGTLMNMPEFSEVFQCPLGSDMNPLKKCVIW